MKLNYLIREKHPVEVITSCTRQDFLTLYGAVLNCIFNTSAFPEPPWLQFLLPAGTMIPQSGAEYTYIHEAFGPVPAFLYLWMVVTIGVPSSRAIGSLTFANYILQPFFPDCQQPPDSALRLVGILLIREYCDSGYYYGYNSCA